MTPAPVTEPLFIGRPRFRVRLLHRLRAVRSALSMKIDFVWSPCFEQNRPFCKPRLADHLERLDGLAKGRVGRPLLRSPRRAVPAVDGLPLDKELGAVGPKVAFSNGRRPLMPAKIGATRLKCRALLDCGKRRHKLCARKLAYGLELASRSRPVDRAVLTNWQGATRATRKLRLLVRIQ